MCNLDFISIFYRLNSIPAQSGIYLFFLRGQLIKKLGHDSTNPFLEGANSFLITAFEEFALMVPNDKSIKMARWRRI